MRIFTPEDTFISPQVVDGVENLLTKTGTAQTQSTSFAELRSIQLVPNIFSGDNDRIKLEMMFRFLGAAGNKRVNIELQLGAGLPATLFDSGNQTLTNSSGKIELLATMQGSVFKSFTTLIAGTDGTAQGSTLFIQGNISNLAVDPTILHLLSIRALVTNAADTVILDWIGGSFR